VLSQFQFSPTRYSCLQSTESAIDVRVREWPHRSARQFLAGLHVMRRKPATNCTLLIEAWTFKTFSLSPAGRRERLRNAARKMPRGDMRLDGLAVMQVPVGSRAFCNEMSASTGLIAASREPKSNKKGNSLHWKTWTNN
jgi:hypothetical protein